MYIVLLNYTRPFGEVEALLDAHLVWLDKYFDAGVFISAGRKEPRTGGMIMVRDIDRDRLNAILNADPFQAVAEYEVTKVNVTRTQDAFSSLRNS